MVCDDPAHCLRINVGLLQQLVRCVTSCLSYKKKNNLTFHPTQSLSSSSHGIRLRHNDKFFLLFKKNITLTPNIAHLKSQTYFEIYYKCNIIISTFELFDSIFITWCEAWPRGVGWVGGGGCFCTLICMSSAESFGRGDVM